MTRGVLLFAIDTSDRSYFDMAVFCAKKIKEHLNLPVTVVTNKSKIKKTDKLVFDKIINHIPKQAQKRTAQGISGVEVWNNFNRCLAYDLTPYDETILMDTDYICGSNQLLKLFESTSNILCHRRRKYLGSQKTTDVECYGKNFEMYWATVIFFRKSKEAESVFDMMKMIQENYYHYSRLYGFRETPYRNDYSFSIALNTVYGHILTSEIEIPWPLMNVEFATKIKIIEQNSWQLEFDKMTDGKTKSYRIQVKNQDLHMLNKQSLMEQISCHKDM